MNTIQSITLKPIERDAILAGLRLLQRSIGVGQGLPDGIGDIYADGGAGRDTTAIDALCESLNTAKACTHRAFLCQECGSHLKTLEGTFMWCPTEQRYTALNIHDHDDTECLCCGDLEEGGWVAIPEGESAQSVSLVRMRQSKATLVEDALAYIDEHGATLTANDVPGDDELDPVRIVVFEYDDQGHRVVVIPGSSEPLGDEAAHAVATRWLEANPVPGRCYLHGEGVAARLTSLVV